MSDTFWTKFLEQGIHSDHSNDDLQDALSYLQTHSPDSIPSKERAVSLLFHRINSSLSENYFGDINLLIISLLSELAPFASLSHFQQPGLYESIFVLFMNDPKTFDKSIEFLEKFYDRDDIHLVFDDFLMITIINLSNFSPPKPQLWRFMCKYFAKFGEQIEEMCDFKALDSNGLLPIFTRSLIWTYRNIYQNPPDKTHEEDFWQLWKNILFRYKKAIFDLNSFKSIQQDPNDAHYKEINDIKRPVMGLFEGLMNEIRLSIYFGLHSALENGNYVSETPLEVWKLLHEIDCQELISFLESQLENDALHVALKASLQFCGDEYRDRVQSMLSQYESS